MSPNPSTIPRVSGCLAIITAAAVGACGGAESTSNALMTPQSVSAPSERSKVPTPAPAPTVEPAPAPSPTTVAAMVPAVDKAKIPKGSVGYSSELLAPTTQQPMYTDIGAFRTVCEFSHMAFDDPIVYPGQPGRSHLHVFFGNTGIERQFDRGIDRQHRQLDLPRRNGQPQRLLGPGHHRHAATARRSSRTVDDHLLQDRLSRRRAGQIQSLPAGLRMIAGDSKDSAPYQWRRSRASSPASIRVPATGPQDAELPTDLPRRQHDLGDRDVPAVLGRRQSRLARPQEPHVVPGQRRLPGDAPCRRFRKITRQRPHTRSPTRRRWRAGDSRPTTTTAASRPATRRTPTGSTAGSRRSWTPSSRTATSRRRTATRTFSATARRCSASAPSRAPWRRSLERVSAVCRNASAHGALRHAGGPLEHRSADRCVSHHADSCAMTAGCR